MKELKYSVFAECVSGEKVELNNIPLKESSYNIEGFFINIKKNLENFDVQIIPPNSRLKNIKHRVTLGLRNFHTVIVPDSGRGYPAHMQLVNFWAPVRESRHFDIKVPLFIFTGQNHNTSFAFGLIGEDYETEFRCLEPGVNRALLAHFKRLTIEICRGIPNFPIPESIACANDDFSVTEGIFVRDYNGETGLPWVEVLNSFSESVRNKFNLQYLANDLALKPLWCSWTDWHSSTVTESVMLDNVKAGKEVGIDNYILDDGWFGPGLDHEFGTKLIFGDWEPDGVRFKDMKKLSNDIRDAGGKSIIWCAPHNITPTAKAFRKNYDYVMKDKFGVPILTGNKLNLLCPCCKESREVIADNCVRLALEYDTDGAKYDLFNTYPNEECCAHEHTHDVSSYVQGLYLLMELIWNKVSSVRPDYIIELKQNYGWVFLSRFGSMVRAGDTPYNPEGNFMRTAFVAGYTPFACNDYQTITKYDTPQDSAKIIIKMISVGIPSYSMDIGSLLPEHKKVLKFYNELYLEMIDGQSFPWRRCIDADLGVWHCAGKEVDYYYTLNNGQYISLVNNRDFVIANGSIYDELIISLDHDAEITLIHKNCFGEVTKQVKEKFVANEKKVIKTEVSGVVQGIITRA